MWQPNQKKKIREYVFSQCVDFFVSRSRQHKKTNKKEDSNKRKQNCFFPTFTDFPIAK